jgi:hypothetical protein
VVGKQEQQREENLCFVRQATEACRYCHAQYEMLLYIISQNRYRESLSADRARAGHTCLCTGECFSNPPNATKNAVGTACSFKRTVCTAGDEVKNYASCGILKRPTLQNKASDTDRSIITYTRVRLSLLYSQLTRAHMAMRHWRFRNVEGYNNSPIRSTARGKIWAALSGTCCIEN